MILAKVFLFLVSQSMGLALAQSTNADNLYRIDLSELRPTQMNVGMIEVARKSAKLSEMTGKQRDLFLRENPVPVIVGPAPKKHFYLIDHHHLSRAVLESGHSKVYIKVVADLSELPRDEFWKEMSKKGYVYLKDDLGNAIEPSQLPKHISTLGDDPYRSLAGVVRRQGGYIKDTTPFAEFKWAAFFRERIKIDDTKPKYSFAKAVAQAMVLVSSDEAQGLPGYRFRCESVFLASF